MNATTDLSLKKIQRICPLRTPNSQYCPCRCHSLCANQNAEKHSKAQQNLQVAESLFRVQSPNLNNGFFFVLHSFPLLLFFYFFFLSCFSPPPSTGCGSHLSPVIILPCCQRWYVKALNFSFFPSFFIIANLLSNFWLLGFTGFYSFSKKKKCQNLFLFQFFFFSQ